MDIVLTALKARVQVMKFLSTITGSRKIRNYFIRKRLAKYEFTVFSNNCIGGVFLHDANKRFNSPTVNLATNGDGFIKFLSNPESFYDGEFEETDIIKRPFPVGVYKGMYVSFVHYKTLEEGKEKWKLRSKRIIKDHIYIVATGHNGLETPKNMELFDKLPYKHKVMFTFGKWDYEWAKQVKHHHGKDIPFTGIVTLTGKRFYETASFDLPKWISSCEENYCSQ